MPITENRGESLALQRGEDDQGNATAYGEFKQEQVLQQNIIS